ncbi:phosphoenolpyruvate hydrolase family protein [Salibacterium lacus]|uniref:Phosphoenolpyruvate hydrolase family protein n=1 Tax=Salibacterium lacus TaxID=1898109 RepID=A0ABW5T557_9BACI
MSKKEATLTKLHQQIRTNKQLIGVAAGSGLTAKNVEKGGADFLLALSSGRFRQMGVSSLAGFLAYANSNDVVMHFASTELLPIARDIPICFGLCATDPTIDLEDYIERIKQTGFSGVNNFPSVGHIDGVFGEALEERGITFDKEIEAIRIASEKELFTVAFVFNETQAVDMARAGADVICVHLGLTEGGALGSKKILSLQSAKQKALRIFESCTRVNPNVIQMIYGGPVNKPIDVQFMYDGTNITGYIGGSVFERIPTEQTFTMITESFKQTSDFQYEELIQKIMNGMGSRAEYVSFVKTYIRSYYMYDITMQELAQMLNVTRPHLSSLFKQEMGLPFKQYLIEFRISRAKEIIQTDNLPLHAVAEMTGYQDYFHFSKIFKKYTGMSPAQFQHLT